MPPKIHPWFSARKRAISAAVVVRVIKPVFLLDKDNHRD